MYRAKQISPMIPSYDIPETARFFTDILNFSIGRFDKSYVILFKEQTTVHVLSAGDEIGEIEFYLEVDDIESVWANRKTKVTHLQVKEPFDRDYGMREVHVIIPYTKAFIFIGQVIPSFK